MIFGLQSPLCVMRQMWEPNCQDRECCARANAQLANVYVVYGDCVQSAIIQRDSSSGDGQMVSETNS